MSDTSHIQSIAERYLRIPAKLHDYQWDGVAFLYRSQSALLADEMGLGKTVQVIIALALLISDRKNGIDRTLIVAPTALVPNWLEELKTWAPSITAWRIEGGGSSREAFYLLPIPILVCSYEQIRADGLDRIPAETFDLVILDEAQRIKNKKSATALACRLLPRQRSWALSATPLENNESDLISLLEFLGVSLKQNPSRSYLTSTLKTIMLRRRKSDVRSELPPVIVQDLKLELSASQREKYNEVWTNRATIIDKRTANEDINTALLGLITRLKIICNYDAEQNVSSKLEALTEIFSGAEKSARILVFSQFVQTLRWLASRITLPYSFLTGSMSADEKLTAIKQFKDGSTPRAFLVSLRAGGVGLNLGEATHVVLFDRWWNPAAEIQAIYRAHRFERSAPLHVLRFLVTDTIEERIAGVLQKKHELFGDIVEYPEPLAAGNTREELMQILELAVADISSLQNLRRFGSCGKDC